METTKVLLVDPYPVLREGVCALLETEADMTVVQETGDYNAVLPLCREQQPDLLLLGVEQAGEGTVVLVKDLKEAAPQTNVLVMAAEYDEACTEALIAAGASGCLLKVEERAQVREAVRAVARGETRFSPLVVEALVRVACNGPQPRPTERQLEVLRLAAGGQTNAQIAQTLDISESTVRYHLRQLYRRLDVDTRTEAVAEAVRRGWV